MTYRNQRFAKRIFTCALLLLIAAAAWGASTPAGTVIRNQARASVGGETYLSNEVDTTIRAVCSPNLTPNGTPSAPGQRVTVSADSRAYVPYTLTNAGNDRFTFDLSVVLGAGTWTPDETTLYRDRNRNGRLDSGEEAVSAVTLESGEAVALVLEVVTPAGVTGDRALSPVATCGGGRSDTENYALVQVVQGPTLQLFKTLSDPELSPGETVRFDLRILNNGTQPALSSVLYTDDFELANLDGLTFVSRSATATRGTVEYSDGTTWTEAEPDDVRGVRLRLPSLAVGGEALLSFEMRASAEAAAGTRQNRAFATGPGGPTEVNADFSVTARYRHALGPVGNPRALAGGEGSVDDLQTQRLIYAQEGCFTHTLENTGTVPDRYTLTYSGLPSDVSATLRSTNGATLPGTLELRAGERRDVKLCFTASQVVPPFTATLTATSLETGATNLTYDRVDEVIVAGSALDLVKSADPTGSVAEGEVLTYTLSVTNSHDFDLNNLRVSDALPGFERTDGEPTSLGAPAFVAASDGGAYDEATRTVTWRVARLGAGESATFTVQVRMPADIPEDIPDDTLYALRNRFDVGARELMEPKTSNEVVHTFPLLTLNIDKRVEEEVVRIGDTLYYTVTVANPNAVPLTLTIVDTPPARTRYVEGSAVVGSGGTEKQLEPERRGDELVWDLTGDPDFRLEPKGSASGRDKVSVRYALTVQPGVSTPLENTAYALGVFGEGTGAVSGVVITSEEVEVAVEVDERVLTQPDALLSGRVYLDTNRNARYEYGLDLPLPGARLLLPNGWQTLTDAEGRYTFRDLAPGAWSVTLDAASAPFAPLPHPEGPGEGYQHRVVLQGLTVSDFPLAAPAGVASASRQTTLRFGPLTVEKRLVALPEGVRVVLRLTSEEPLPELVVVDPVPGAAPRRFTFEVFEGDETLTYDLSEGVGLTDPNARWRYP